MKRIIFLAVVAIMAAIACSIPKQNSSLPKGAECTLRFWKDGDTFFAKCQGMGPRLQEIRIEGIDAPESSSPAQEGPMVSLFHGETIFLTYLRYDRYTRIVARVFLLDDEMFPSAINLGRRLIAYCIARPFMKYPGQDHETFLELYKSNCREEDEKLRKTGRKSNDVPIF